MCCLLTKQEYVQLQNDVKIVRTLPFFVRKSLFSLVFFSSFNPNLGYGNQRRLFSGNMPGMFTVDEYSENKTSPTRLKHITK